MKKIYPALIAVAIAVGIPLLVLHHSVKIGAPTTGDNSGIVKNSTSDISNEIGQTLMIGISSTTLTAADRSLIETVKPGGIILFARNIKTQTQTTKLIADLQSVGATYSSSSLFIAVDEEGGAVSRLPWVSVKTGEPAITTTSFASQVATQRAAALRAIGANVDLAPVLDAATSTDFLYDRTFHVPLATAGELGAAMIRSYAAGGVLSTMKHFPGYVGIPSDPEKKLYRIPVPATKQFTIAAAADPAFVMVSNIIYPSLDAVDPCPLSSGCIAYLHAQVPGNYLVITDDLSDPVMRTNYDIGSEVAKAMHAGVDVELVASGITADTMAAYRALVDGVDNGTISRQKIMDEYNKIVAVKKGI